MDLKIPPKKQGRQIGGDIGLTIKATGAPTKRTKIELCFRRFYLEPLILKKSIQGKRLLRSQPPDLYRSPLHSIYGSKLCKRIRVHEQKERRKRFGQQQEPEKSRAVTLYKAAAPLTPLPAAGIPICRKQGIPGFRKGGPKSL